MARTSWTILLPGLLVCLACTEPDLRDTKPDRTRNADGIIKLYGNRQQGDWMLKGKVIQVESAVVVEAIKNGSPLAVTGQDALTPISMTLDFHSSETRGTRLAPGDLVTFKGICRGMDGTIRFDSCIILGVSTPVSTP